jgi:hypothetical protein
MFELRRLSDHLTSLTDMALRGKLKKKRKKKKKKKKISNSTFL